jgi:hypothetical protein
MSIGRQHCKNCKYTSNTRFNGCGDVADYEWAMLPKTLQGVHPTPIMRTPSCNFIGDIYTSSELSICQWAFETLPPPLVVGSDPCKISETRCPPRSLYDSAEKRKGYFRRPQAMDGKAGVS